MKNRFLILIIFGFIFISGCEENIIIEPHPFKSQLSVECILEPDALPKLYLGKTVGYFDPRTSNLDLFVDNALVTISSNGIVDTLLIKNKFNYYLCTEEYFYQGTIPIAQGKQYHLRIQHDNKIYEADTKTNVSPVEIGSISYIENFSDLYGEHEGVVVSFTDLPNQTNNYRYRMDRVLDSSNTDISNCAVGPYPATELGRTIFFDTNIDGTTMTLIIEPVFKHNQGDVAQVYLQTLDAASARFFDDLDQQKNSKFNPFIEPVFITSNIPGAFGIFGACNYSQPFNFTYPE